MIVKLDLTEACPLLRGSKLWLLALQQRKARRVEKAIGPDETISWDVSSIKKLYVFQETVLLPYSGYHH